MWKPARSTTARLGVGRIPSAPVECPVDGGIMRGLVAPDSEPGAFLLDARAFRQGILPALRLDRSHVGQLARPWSALWLRSNPAPSGMELAP
jgi:hypothetical protein